MRDLRKEMTERKTQRKRVRRVRILEREIQNFQAYRQGVNSFTVVNYVKCTVYEVDLDEKMCSCPDAQFSLTQKTYIYCKHLLFVSLLVRRDGTNRNKAQ